MSWAVVRPDIVDFIEIVTETPELDLTMEGVPVEDTSRLVGETLATSGIARELELIIIAIKRGSGEMLFNPMAHTSIEAGDTLITMGEAERIDRLREAARSRA